MTKTVHVCWDRAGLVIEVVRQWPVTWLLDPATGEPFTCVGDAVQAILDIPTPFVPCGCPTPDAEGRCPGHEEAAP